jgi:oligosaccharide repeat unit polymerase
MTGRRLTVRASSSPPVHRGSAVVPLVGQGALVLLAVVLLFESPAELPDTYVLSAGLTLFFVWALVSWRLAGRRLFDPYCLFLIAAFLFNAGHALLEVMDLNAAGLMNGIFSEAIARETLVLSFAGLAALHFGALFTVSVRSRQIAPLQWASPACETWVRRIGWIQLVVGASASALWSWQAVRVAAASGYASLYERDLPAGVAATPFLLSGFLVPGALFLTVSGRRHQLDRRVSATAIVLLAAVQFYLGYRSTAAMPLIAWMWLSHRAVRPFKWPVLAGWAILLVFVVFPLVRETRNMSQAERSTSSYLENFLRVDNPAISSVHEMGSTMATTAHTLTLVPASRPFDLGEGYAFALLSLFPNLFWDIHPTIVRGTANDWLVRSINPWLASRGGAYGYSCIAEAYLNFGKPGVPLMMCLYGLLFVTLVLWAEKSGDPAKLALAATVLAFVLRFARDELTGIIRPVVWYAVVPYLSIRFAPVVMNGAVKTLPAGRRPRVPSSEVA